MEYVIRPCIAYGSGAVDGVHNNALSSGTGFALVNGASRVVRGDKTYFEGDDYTCEKLGGAWATYSNFSKFLDRAIRFTMLCGSAPIKIDIDRLGRSSLSAVRLDRSLISTDDAGNVNSAVFFVSILSNLKREIGEQIEYWLVEERKYNEALKPVIVYKVFRKSGVANSPTLPSPYQVGVSFENLPPRVKQELVRNGINRLNEEMELPFTDGLGVWLLTRTGVNSCVPGCAVRRSSLIWSARSSLVARRRLQRLDDRRSERRREDPRAEAISSGDNGAAAGAESRHGV